MGSCCGSKKEEPTYIGEDYVLLTHRASEPTEPTPPFQGRVEITQQMGRARASTQILDTRDFEDGICLEITDVTSVVKNPGPLSTVNEDRIFLFEPDFNCVSGNRSAVRVNPLD